MGTIDGKIRRRSLICMASLNFDSQSLHYLAVGRKAVHAHELLVAGKPASNKVDSLGKAQNHEL